jgi:hypothetical protein
MTTIYIDSNPCQHSIDQLNNPALKKVFDINEFVMDKDSVKVAVFHIPFPYDINGYDAEFERKVNQVIGHCDKIIVLISELHRSTTDFINRYQSAGIDYCLCGFVTNIKSTAWMDWFITSCYFYKNNPNVLTKLTPFDVKPKTFDILLGMPKPHRDFAYDYIISNNLQDRAVMTYLGHPNLITVGKNNRGWIWEDEGLEMIDPSIVNIQWTVSQVKYYGQQMSLSQVVPINIYNQTAYTVVAETNFDNHYSFYTEKIVKPILGQRLFLVFSGRHYLKNLRSLGFRTFDGIIDESYDTVWDNEQRWALVCEQMQYLFDQPQEQILAKIQPIVEHNKRVMLETDWWQDFTKEFQSFLHAHEVQN